MRRRFGIVLECKRSRPLIQGELGQSLRLPHPATCHSVLKTGWRAVLAKLAVGVATPLLWAGAALAEVPFPVHDVLPYLQSRVTFPILLPDTLPLDATTPIYISAEAEYLRYSLSIDSTESCRGATACNIGMLTAEVGGYGFDPRELLPGDSFELVTLSDGTQAGYFNFCGAYCSAILQWERGGVLYTVYVKNGRREDVLAIANSAISEGVR